MLDCDWSSDVCSSDLRLDVATGETAVSSALATLEVRRRELESAKAQLIQPGEGGARGGECCIEVRAPVSGRVLKIIAESEQVVAAGSPLVEIGDPSDLEIAVDLLSRDAVRVEPGATARIESWGGEGSLAAKVRRVEPTGYTKVSALGIEEQRVRVVLDLVDRPEAWRRLGHTFRVVARIIVWRGEGVVQVPIGALFRSGESWAVFVIADGRARLRALEIGERNQRYARVAAGLGEGEAVILHPGEAVRDGVRVEPRPR
jgi:HlyD family secretion protein